MIFAKAFSVPAGRLRGILREHWGLVIFLILLSVFRFSLITRGHQFWADENRYQNAFSVIEALGKGDVASAGERIFNARGRPWFVIFSSVPASLQLLAQRIGWVSLSDPHSYDIPSFFNAVFSLLIAILFYRILLTLIKNIPLSLLGTIVYSLLCNSNIYIRHLFPVDLSLSLFMFALFFVLAKDSLRDVRQIILLGVISTIAFMTYVGYYGFFLVIITALLCKAKDKAGALVTYALSAAGVVLVVEGISRLFGQSYFYNSFILSTDVTQGSFEEGYVFLFKYLMDVEGMIGYLLIALLSVYVVGFFLRERDPLSRIFGVLAATYFLHATAGVFFQKIVFYGRIIHMYLPFIVMAGMRVVSAIPKKKVRMAAAAGVLVVSAVSFSGYAYSYWRMEYPQDFQHRYLSQIPDPLVCKTDEVWEFMRFDVDQCPALAVNITTLYPIRREYRPVVPSDQMVLIKSSLHPIWFPGHWYEGYSQEERELIRERDYQMRIYLNKRLLRGSAVE